MREICDTGRKTESGRESDEGKVRNANEHLQRQSDRSE